MHLENALAHYHARIQGALRELLLSASELASTTTGPPAGTSFPATPSNRDGGGTQLLHPHAADLGQDEHAGRRRQAVACGPGEVREWSPVMAMVGFRNALDRGLVAENDILVHGSGCHAAGEFDELALPGLHQVGEDGESLRDVVLEAATL